jgi:hypothetical protein
MEYFMVPGFQPGFNQLGGKGVVFDEQDFHGYSKSRRD